MEFGATGPGAGRFIVAAHRWGIAASGVKVATGPHTGKEDEQVIKGILSGVFFGTLIGSAGLLVASLAANQPAGNTPPARPQVEAPAAATADPQTDQPVEPALATDETATTPVPQVETATTEPSVPLADTVPLALPETAAVEGALQAPEVVALPDIAADAEAPVLPNPQTRAPQVPVAEEDVVIATETATPVAVEETPAPDTSAAAPEDETPEPAAEEPPAEVAVVVTDAPQAEPATPTAPVPVAETPAPAMPETAAPVIEAPPAATGSEAPVVEPETAEAPPVAAAPEPEVAAIDPVSEPAAATAPAVADAATLAPQTPVAEVEPATPPVVLAPDLPETPEAETLLAEAPEADAPVAPVAEAPVAPTSVTPDAPEPDVVVGQEPAPESLPALIDTSPDQQLAEAPAAPEPAPAAIPEPAPAPAPEPEDEAPGVVSIIEPGSSALPQLDTGVRVNRSLGNSSAPAPDPAPAPEPIALDPDAPAIERYATPFEPADTDLPLMSVILIDDGSLPSPEVALSDLPFPVTVALDPIAPDAAARMAAYRARGIEVALRPILPQGARATDVEVNLQAAFETLPETVLLLDPGDAGVQESREVTAQTLAALSEDTRGFVTVPRGFNSGLREAQSAGLPAAEIFRDLDGDGQDARVIRRFMDQAAFRARQDGSVVLLGRVRAETLTALILWGTANRAGQVEMAPASALLMAGQGS